VNDKGWEAWKERLPKSHIWECVKAERSKNKRRTKDFIVEKKRKWSLKECDLLLKKMV